MRHQALHDTLTGLPNRAVFRGRVGLALAAAERNPQAQFALLFIDLDHFKQVNDSLGHAAGDELLIAVSRRLERLVRPQDTLTRLGGDEFAILVGDAREPEVAVRVADRVLAALAEPLAVAGQQVAVSASVGIALSRTGYASAEAILHDADAAMYRAKHGGRGCCHLFDETMHDQVMARLQLEAELAAAVTDRAFVLHYQPVVCLASDRVVGFEGLVRWRHPLRGLLAPARFLAVAEASGSMVPIGWFVIEEGCRQLARWQRAFPLDPPLWLSLNLSPRLLMQADMVDRLVAILAASGLDPRTLHLEVTERLIAEHGEPAIARILELSALGVRFAVDDFGERFDSIKVLERVGFSSLKVDPRLIGPVDDPASTPFLLQTILSLAGSLGMSVVAEGVERASQRATLRALQCPQGQGFLFSKALAAGEAERLLVGRPGWAC